MKTGYLVVFAFASIGLTVGFKQNILRYFDNEPKVSDLNAAYQKGLKIKIGESIDFTHQNHYDTGLVILIDYKKHSGLKRAFLVDLSRKLVFDSLMVSHGCGQNQWGDDESKDNAIFSNEFESHCTSLGRYKIGKRAKSQWGIYIKYFLHGLDPTNNNAYKRTIVLHGWDQMTDYETYPDGSPEGWGCPAFSNADMFKLDSILQSRRDPVLLWAY